MRGQGPSAPPAPERRGGLILNELIRRGLLGVYRVAKVCRVLDTAWGRGVFERTYHIYKDRVEAGPVESLRRWVRPKTVVIDVGANLGFFTLRFATWVEEGGRVLALEPEPGNFAGLERAVARAGRTAVVETIQAAAADVTGTGFLQLNPWHPGDHRLGTNGLAVASITLDDLLRARGWPEVSLIKIDVQGAEGRVLAGAAETLDRFRPALFLEIEVEKLRQNGSDERDLLTSCVLRGYAIHAVDREGVSALLSVDAALAHARAQARGYIDLLLLVVPPAR